MAIEGLLIPAPEQLYRAGTPNVEEAVGETLEAYRALGFAPDGRAAETISEDFGKSAEVGYDGFLYVRAPKEVSFDAIIAAAEGKRPEKVDPVFRHPNLWTPGTEAESFTNEDLNQAPAQPQARLALYNADTQTGVDPLLHHLNIPADDYAKKKYGGETTQVAEVAKDIKVFEAKHPEFDLDDLDHRDFAMIALMNRIRGIEPKDMILSAGFMNILKLRRCKVDGDSCVGHVCSFGGQLYLYRSVGRANPYDGVGVSMGPRQIPKLLS